VRARRPVAAMRRRPVPAISRTAAQTSFLARVHRCAL